MVAVGGADRSADEKIKEAENARKAFVVVPCNDDITAVVDNEEEMGIVCKNWKESWKKAGFSESDFVDDWKECTVDFIQKSAASLRYKTFVAHVGSREIVGSISCQIWAGPIPWVIHREIFCLGTIWALHVDLSLSHEDDKSKNAIASALVQAAVSYLRTQGCKKIVVLDVDKSNGGRDVLINAGVGFKSANMLTLDLADAPAVVRDVGVAVVNSSSKNVELIPCQPEGEDLDETVCMHWRNMWKEVGIPEEGLQPTMNEITLSFIRDARERLHYQTFVARRSSDNKVVGSVSCQVWEGPFPKIAKPDSFQLGTIWAVYVDPEFRRRGIATAMMRSALAHLHKVGCDTAVLIAASKGGQCVYERLGFRPNNALVCDLSNDERSTKEPQDSGSPCGSSKAGSRNGPASSTPVGVVSEELRNELQACLSAFELAEHSDVAAMLTATQQQLSAVFKDRDDGQGIIDAVIDIQQRHGLYVDPDNNWFTQNVKRFGRGFDMKKLAADQDGLASKFDRLSTNYDHWTVGNRSKVESFIAKCAKDRLLPLQVERVEPLRVLDVACGIGLQGQVLRLCGFRGEILGTDIAPGMVKRVVDRGCYNRAFVANANLGLASDSEGLSAAGGLYDVVICTGAMELLDQPTALRHIARATKPQGELWVSFQHDCIEAGVDDNPTSHQNIKGITECKAVEQLNDAGFEVLSVEACEDAFYTPSPTQNGALLAVPYLFIVGKKRQE